MRGGKARQRLRLTAAAQLCAGRRYPARAGHSATELGSARPRCRFCNGDSWPRLLFRPLQQRTTYRRGVWGARFAPQDMPRSQRSGDEGLPCGWHGPRWNLNRRSYLNGPCWPHHRSAGDAAGPVTCPRLLHRSRNERRTAPASGQRSSPARRAQRGWFGGQRPPTEPRTLR